MSMQANPNRLVIVWFILGVLLFSSCGFRLRGAIDLPPEMKSIWVDGISVKGPFVNSLRNSLRGAGGNISRDRNTAGMILNVLEERMARREISLTQTGKANEFELTYTLRYELLKPGGDTLVPEQTIVVVRDYFNEQVNVIGKSREEDLIRKEIYDDAVRSLVRKTGVALGRTSIE